MKVGISRSIIHPILPSYLAGYAVSRKATQIHDHIYTRLLLFDNQHTKYAFINLDLIGIDKPLYTNLLQLAQSFGVTKEHVMISCTHTHSAPGGTLDVNHGIMLGKANILGDNDDDFCNIILKATKDAFHEAIDNMSNMTIKRSVSTLDHVGSNRNNERYAGDHRFLSYFIENEKGKKVVLYNYACHPTILKPNNIMISADLPGKVSELCEDTGLGFAFFLNGSAGDISTRFTRKQEGYDELDRYAHIILDTISHLQKEAVLLDSFSIQTKWMNMDLKVKKAESIETAQQKLDAMQCKRKQGLKNHANEQEIRLLESYVEGAQVNLDYAKTHPNIETSLVSIQLLHFGEDSFFCFPGEMFSELSNKIRNNHVFFISYANGYQGYFANMEAYDQQFYEATSSPFKRGEAEKLIAKIQEKDNEIVV